MGRKDLPEVVTGHPAPRCANLSLGIRSYQGSARLLQHHSCPGEDENPSTSLCWSQSRNNHLGVLWSSHNQPLCKAQLIPLLLDSCTSGLQSSPELALLLQESSSVCFGCIPFLACFYIDPVLLVIP